MSHHPYINKKERTNERKKERKKERRKSKQGHTGCQLISLFQRLSFFFAAGFRRDFN